jgi:hypothetical protein
MYRSRPRLFLGIGLFFVPLGLVITGLQYLLFRHGPISPLVGAAGETNISVSGLALGLGIFITVLGLNVVLLVRHSLEDKSATEADVLPAEI